MKNYVPCPWSDNLANSTAISFVLLIGILVTVIVILVLFYHRIPKEWLYWVLIPMIVVIGGSCVSCVAFAPRGVSVDEKEIILYRYMGKVTIPRSEITDIRPYPTKGTTIRLCGIGGCMGNVGLFRHSEIGNFTAYYTDPSRSYVIYRRSKRPIVITSVEPLE